MTKGFRLNEKYLSQILALQQLVNSSLDCNAQPWRVFYARVAAPGVCRP